MDISISYNPTIYYNKSNIIQWAYMFEKYTYIKGFKLRLLGIYINVREKNATEKLIKIGHTLLKAKNSF